MADFKVITPKRDIARELARKYSTMTHDELDVMEDILEPIKYGKGEMILPYLIGSRISSITSQADSTSELLRFL